MPKFDMTDIDRERARMYSGYIAGYLNPGPLRALLSAASRNIEDETLKAVHILLTMATGGLASRIDAVAMDLGGVRDNVKELETSVDHLQARLDRPNDHVKVLR